MNEIYGAVIGDIAGSIYEVIEVEQYKKALKIPKKQRMLIMNSSTSIFNKNCEITDDTILTCAIANAILTGEEYSKSLKTFGLNEIDLGVDKYGRSRFGGNFVKWCQGEEINSYGNGCAMRVSAIGLAFDSLEKTLIEAEKSTVCSHNFPECIKLTKAVAGAIYLARNKKSRKEIKKFCENEIGHEIKFNLNYLRENYIFTSKAEFSIPQALFCFFVSNSFEDCLRKSISIGGDSDTICAIACSIAAAYYGIPENILNEAKRFIPKKYLDILEKFNKCYGLKYQKI